MPKEIEYFAQGSTDAIAQQLLGSRLLYHSPQGLMGGLIVETEAYLGPLDSTAHSYQNKHTKANEPIYSPPGVVYIYTIYGQFLLNVTTQKMGIPQAVLIRAIEPTVGKDLMLANRPKKSGFEMTNGPGKLMKALGIQDRRMNFELFGESALDIDLFKPKIPKKIGLSARIGVSNIDSWAEKPLRFFVSGNPYVSGISKRDMDLENFGWR
ncbi:DNA-3-methyladenine glycosylase [Lentilactobacillus laojiaonis]|uniref:DNA-3-methyladenine glycosylase n=1 Tax=Lentilactobacillus laojiaonis TaxID=2883998 RepID=UPI001D0BAA90|nr:DNA-3-methyladenine glycosylase [Lentilactobacillus laojiaonis]UDM32265.1 DNA-3-methyladenine glycosylase [Lentilactobacillus laojiaonis]